MKLVLRVLFQAEEETRYFSYCMRKYRNRLRRMKQFWSIRYFIRIPGGAWEVKKDLLHSCSRSS